MLVFLEGDNGIHETIAEKECDNVWINFSLSHWWQVV
jgi:hypothetical protein